MSTNSSHLLPPPTTCFSAVLRRLLCAGSLPTHPSDQFPENSGHKEVENYSKPEVIVKQGTRSSPGVVAKLMGLDSFPDTPSWAHKDRRRSLGSFLRSRSANSIDFLPPFDPARQHRRARTSVSFREGLHYPHYVSMVSILEKVGEIGEGGEEKRGGSECIEKLWDRKVSRKKVEMEEEKRWVGVEPWCKRRKDLVMKKRVTLKKAGIETVGFKEELVQPKIKESKMHSGSSRVHPSEIIRPGHGHSRRTVDSHTRSTSPYTTTKADSRNEETTTRKGKKEKKIRNKERCYYKRTVELEITSVYENEGFEEYVWKWVGQEIVQGLLEQFVDELYL